MVTNVTYTEAEIQRTAIFAYDEAAGVFRACEVDSNGVLSTTAGSGSGGSGGDVRIKDATLSQFASVDATGRLSVLVANFPATQPISGTVALDAPSLAALEVTTVAVSNFPATQPVSGTIAVSNFPATQPVSGTVSISGSVAVTGPLTDAQLRASAVPVSLASVPSHAVTGPLTDAQLRATAVPVSGTLAVTGPLTDAQLRASAVPVSLAALPPLVAGTANIGDVDVLTLPALPAGTNRIGAVRLVDSADVDLTSAKYTQPAGRSQSVHDVKDTGRTLIVFSFGSTGGGHVSTASADTMLTMSWSKDGAAPATGTSYAVVAGKRLRIMSLWILERSTTGNTTATTAFCRMRINTAGAVVVASPLQFQVTMTHPAAANVASAIPPWQPSWPDGMELQAGWNLGFSIGSSAWTATTCVPIWDGLLMAYEY